MQAINAIQAAELYENTNGNATAQKQGKRRSWHIMPNKVGSEFMETGFC